MNKENNVYWLHRDELRQMDAAFDAAGDHHDWHQLTDKYNALHREEHAKLEGGELNKMQYEFCQYANGKTWDEIMKG